MRGTSARALGRPGHTVRACGRTDYELASFSAAGQIEMPFGQTACRDRPWVSMISKSCTRLSGKIMLQRNNWTTILFN
jgi:hypothetical protein